MKHNNLKGSLILCLAALIWGLAFVAQSDASKSVPPFLMNCLRSLISASFLFILLTLKNFKTKTPIIPKNKTDRKTVFLGGLICGTVLAISANFQQFGISLYPENAAAEAHAGFITALYVILVPIFSIFLGKKPSVLVWISVFIAVSGFFLLCFSNGIDTLYLGDLLVFFCAISFSFHIISVDFFVEKVGGIRLSMLQAVVCAIISGVFSLIFEFHLISLDNILSAAFQILYLGIMSSGVAYTLQIIGQRYAEPSIASLTMSLESVFAALGGWFIAGNILSSNEIIGCILVFAAIVLAQTPPSFFIKRKA